MIERSVVGWLTLLLPISFGMFWATNHVVGFNASADLAYMFVSLVLFAAGLYALKVWSRLLYGIIELLFGVAITLVAINA
jgi:hypothetical protein